MKIWMIAAAVGGVALAVLATSQYAELRQLKAEVAFLKTQMGVPEEAAIRTPSDRTDAPVQRGGADAMLGSRVLELEQRVQDLGRTSDYLMERGEAPLTRTKADQMIQELFNPATSERDRLTAVRLLVRSGMFDDNAASFVASMLPTMTDAQVKREMLDQLRGATNGVLKAPMLQMAASDPDADVRARAVQRLAGFSGDPQVAQQLWNSLRDSEGDVRRSAEYALRRLAPDEAILAQARQRGLGADSTIEERFTALRILQGGNQDFPEVAGALAQVALDSQNPDLRLQAIRGFDSTPHPSFVSPLVQGLQDPNPDIRRESADSLSHYRDDPAVSEWLQHVAQSDSDPRVRMEAAQALNGGGRRGGRGGWQGWQGAGR